MSASEFVPSTRSLGELAAAAQRCRGCHLYQQATQTVFGEGPRTARVMFVGEQPGDREDIEGRPFVGPAGKLLEQALLEVGLPREEVYITNAVKHYKWEARGQRRLHKKPDAREIGACRPWLEAEFALITPQLLVCLGATAAQVILGRAFRITQQRGNPGPTAWCDWTLATWHPAALLRVPDRTSRDRMKREFLEDLRQVARELASRTPTPND